MTDFAAKRRHHRVALRVPVDLSTIDPETDRHTGRLYYRDCQELCGNLSTGGMFIATPEPPTPGRRLLLRIHTPDGLHIETVARVAWRRYAAEASEQGRGMGVEFVGPSAKTRAALDRIVNGPANDPASSDG